MTPAPPVGRPQTPLGDEPLRHAVDVLTPRQQVLLSAVAAQHLWPLYRRTKRSPRHVAEATRILDRVWQMAEVGDLCPVSTLGTVSALGPTGPWLPTDGYVLAAVNALGHAAVPTLEDATWQAVNSCVDAHWHAVTLRRGADGPAATLPDPNRTPELVAVRAVLQHDAERLARPVDDFTTLRTEAEAVGERWADDLLGDWLGALPAPRSQQDVTADLARKMKALRRQQ